MGKESLGKFLEQVAASEELKAKIGEEIDTESLIALGAEHGCKFTLEDLQESVQLSDKELDGVAGGALSVFTNVASMTVGKREQTSTFRIKGLKKSSNSVQKNSAGENVLMYN